MTCLQQLGAIEKVKHSDWAAPIIPVPIEDQSVHIYDDFKVTVNPVLRVDQFLLPKPEDLFAIQTGGTKLTKLDLFRAHLQVFLDSQSRQYVTVNTNQGV